MKKIYYTLVVFTSIVGTLFFNTNSVYAQSACSAQESGNCLVQNQTCPGGVIRPDAACSNSPYNQTVCCTPITSVCGVPNADGFCLDGNNDPIGNAVTCTKNSNVCCAPASGCDNVQPIENIFEGRVTNEFFESINPLVIEGDPDLLSTLSTPGGIVTRVLQFLFPLAGLILFIMLVWGGFEILAKSAQGTKGLEAGKNRITAAIVGFLLLFATYWMAQIIEIVFGIVIV